MSIRKVHLLIIVIATLLAYSNIFDNEFLGDDKLYFTTWDEVKDLKNIPSFFAGEEFKDSDIRYRPVGSTFIALNYFVWGENQVGYHITAILLHIMSAVLVYLIVSSLLGGLGRFGGLGAFAAAFLFTLHPANNETVNIVFSSISFGFVNFFASFYFYLRGIREIGGMRDKALSLLFATIAIFSYELTITLPLVIILYGFLFLRRSSHGSHWTHWTNWSNLVPYFLIVLLYLGVRFFVVDIAARAQYIEGSFLKTQFLMGIVFVKYLWLLIFPKELSINHTVLPGVQVWLDPFTNREALATLSFFDLRVLGSIMVIAGIIAIMVIALLRRAPLITFSIGWFFITLLPVSYLIPQDTIMQERYLYLPSFGFVLLLGFLLERLITALQQKVKSSKLKVKNYNAKFKIFNFQLKLFIFHFALLTLVVLAILLYGHRTYVRNQDYKDEVTMWTSIVRQIPNHVMSNYQLASMYAVRGDAKEAIHYYNRVISLEPRIPNVYYETGRIYQRIGKRQEAAQYYQQALSLYPDLILAKVALEEVTGKSEGMSWTQAEVAHTLIIAYPKAWKFTEVSGGGVFVDEKDSFQVEITVDKKRSPLPPEEYVKRDTKSHGRLVQEGLAQIPNTQAAFAKVFEDNGVSKLKLYVFKEGIVIKLLVFPSDSKQMSTVDEMIRSIMVRADV